MKKTKTLTTVLAGLAIALGLTFASCKKGDTGPAGPAGTNGTNGNANVKSQSFTNLIWSFNAANAAYETSVSFSAITQDIVDNGAVMVYLQTGTSYLQLPNSSMYNANTMAFFDFEYYTGGVKLTFSTSDLNNALVPSGTLKYKIVAMSANGRAANPNLNLKNYNEVKQAFNLVD